MRLDKFQQIHAHGQCENKLLIPTCRHKLFPSYFGVDTVDSTRASPLAKRQLTPPLQTADGGRMAEASAVDLASLEGSPDVLVLIHPSMF